MKISLDWLNQYLDRPTDADELARVMTRAGFPVEERVAAGDDVMFDLEVTSNRGDCLSHVGMARELAAASARTLRPPACDPPASAGDAADALTSVALDAPDLCPVYTARVLTGVKVGPSPDWLVRRLEAVGLRSVNNVVDVTNFVMLELGQPLHAFDMDKLAQRRIVIRRAARGEAFTAIDGSRHDLRDDMLVISDADRPVAIAGVMGGLDSEVGDDTVNVLLESAAFDPLSVRRTSRALKLSSDSSFRFERGVDPLGIERASRRAGELILQTAGGVLAPGVVRVGADEPAPGEVSMRLSRCNALLGVELSGEEATGHLDRLHLSPRADGDVMTCTIPSYRLDLQREVDLIEEVARSHGLDAIPMREKIHIIARHPQPAVQARDALSRVLVGHGYHEAITYSFITPRQGQPFLLEGAEALMLSPDMRKAESMMRPSVLPSLLICRKSNQDAGNAGVKLFEAASTWVRSGGSPVETRRLALLRDADDAETAVRDLRGSLEELVSALGGAGAALRVEPVEDTRFGAAGAVSLNGVRIGVTGILSDAIRERFDVQTPIAVAELEADPLLALYPPRREVRELPRLPGIERDLSVVVDEAVAWKAIEEAVRQASPALMESLSFVGAYRGKQVGAGRKSVTLRMRFRDPQATLRHDQVDPQVASVVESLKNRCSAELRG